ncbi:MAG: hypothetical protein ACW96X_13000, partial [Promethearchaeota archaeon]
MIGKEDLKGLLNLSNRNILFEKILNKLKKFANLKYIHYSEFKTSEGTIPIIIIAKSSIPEEIKYVKVFVGSQHNEYNGLFGIMEFLNLIGTSTIPI